MRVTGPEFLSVSVLGRLQDRNKYLNDELSKQVLNKSSMVVNE